MIIRLVATLLCLACLSARAQLDSSSAVLLRPSAGEPEPEDLDSSRYKIRQPESKDDDLDEKPGSLIPSPVPLRPKKEKKVAAPAPAPAVPVPAPVVEAPVAVKPPVPQPVSAQVRELILGGSPEDIEEARKQIQVEDPRANVVSISVAPAYFYESSQSAYSFHRYTANAPGLGLGMNLWLTPFFGVQSGYFTSVTASVANGAADSVPLDVQTFQAGVRFRNHFGYSRKAAQLSWGVDYHDSHDKISRDSTSNVGRASSGLSFSIEGQVPLTNNYAHTFGLEVQPRLHHAELGSGVDVRSGEKSETNALSLSLGGEWILDRRNQVFWKTKYSVERTLFQGPADTVDPSTDLTPNGVSVNESLLVFYFGFKWGS